MGHPDGDVIIEIVLCIFLPPLAIWWHTKQCDVWVIIDIVLMFFFWFPAIIFAVWICFFKGK